LEYVETHKNCLYKCQSRLNYSWQLASEDMPFKEYKPMLFNTHGRQTYFGRQKDKNKTSVCEFPSWGRISSMHAFFLERMSTVLLRKGTNFQLLRITF